MRTPEEEAAIGAFRLAMGRLAQGVCVVATTAGGHDHALTANTVTSVSLDPLLLLVCVETDARFHDAVSEVGVFGVSVLSDDQRGAADWFATQGRPLPGQLDRVPHHRGELGVPLLDDALATFECVVRDIHPAGDHSIVVAEVRASGLAGGTRPALVHFRGRYSALS